jgi:hypothetical protein
VLALESAVEIERIRRGSFEVAGDDDSSCAQRLDAPHGVSCGGFFSELQKWSFLASGTTSRNIADFEGR